MALLLGSRVHILILGLSVVRCARSQDTVAGEINQLAIYLVSFRGGFTGIFSKFSNMKNCHNWNSMLITCIWSIVFPGNHWLSYNNVAECLSSLMLIFVCYCSKSCCVLIQIYRNVSILLNTSKQNTIVFENSSYLIKHANVLLGGSNLE